MIVFGQSDIGTIRSENQDCFEIHSAQGGLLALVCDGMGGAAAGSLASKLTAESFSAAALAALESSNGKNAAQSLLAAADAANRAVYIRSMGDSSCEGMGSTLVALYAAEDGVVVLNVGDSSAHRVHDGALIKLTHDHSYVQELLDSGKITPEQAKHHPRKNIITRVIGGERFVRSDIFESEAEDGDVFLLCSDGVTNAIDKDTLLSICQSHADAESMVHALIDAALAAGARDNVTVVVVIFEKGGGQA